MKSEYKKRKVDFSHGFHIGDLIVARSYGIRVPEVPYRGIITEIEVIETWVNGNVQPDKTRRILKVSWFGHHSKDEIHLHRLQGRINHDKWEHYPIKTK